ncbi:uncharacterized protein Dyak_GE19358 [Drosophila yakuba]|uniref:Uncharacterized protein n=1 Tax=Drosophila yakuba TaxID=7245 RepID=B4NXN0_DROYA|nr:uncharacterized protein Dyak_GE19358 [Drosophila yakuba]
MSNAIFTSQKPEAHIYLNVVRSLRNFSLDGYKLHKLPECFALARLSVDLLHTVCILARGSLWGISHSSLYMVSLETVSAGLEICEILTGRQLTK